MLLNRRQQSQATLKIFGHHLSLSLSLSAQSMWFIVKRRPLITPCLVFGRQRRRTNPAGDRNELHSLSKKSPFSCWYDAEHSFVLFFVFFCCFSERDFLLFSLVVTSLVRVVLSTHICNAVFILVRCVLFLNKNRGTHTPWKGGGNVCPVTRFPLERRWDGIFSFVPIFFFSNWNVLVIVAHGRLLGAWISLSLARVQRALNCVRYIAVLCIVREQPVPNRSSSTGNFLVQFSWRRFERRTVFSSFLLSLCWVCCVCAASDGWIIPFNSIDFCTPQYLRSSFCKTKGKNLAARYWTLFVWLVIRERHPSRFFGCYLFKRMKE